jgi:hypothetical protein
MWGHWAIQLVVQKHGVKSKGDINWWIINNYMFTIKSSATPTIRKVVVRLPIRHLAQTYTTTLRPLTILHHHFLQ